MSRRWNVVETSSFWSNSHFTEVPLGPFYAKRKMIDLIRPKYLTSEAIFHPLIMAEFNRCMGCIIIKIVVVAYITIDLCK